jgi:hypothetical protein
MILPTIFEPVRVMILPTIFEPMRVMILLDCGRHWAR